MQRSHAEYDDCDKNKINLHGLARWLLDYPYKNVLVLPADNSTHAVSDLKIFSWNFLAASKSSCDDAYVEVSSAAVNNAAEFLSR